jgi:hypothetical protein
MYPIVYLKPVKSILTEAVIFSELQIVLFLLAGSRFVGTRLFPQNQMKISTFLVFYGPPFSHPAQ